MDIPSHVSLLYTSKCSHIHFFFLQIAKISEAVIIIINIIVNFWNLKSKKKPKTELSLTVLTIVFLPLMILKKNVEN